MNLDQMKHTYRTRNKDRMEKALSRLGIEPAPIAALNHLACKEAGVI